MHYFSQSVLIDQLPGAGPWVTITTHLLWSLDRSQQRLQQKTAPKGLLLNLGEFGTPHMQVT